MSIFYNDSASFKSLEITNDFIYTNTESFSINGPLQLNPTKDPGTSNISASYLFVSSSVDNTEYNLHYRNNGTLWETHWLEEKTDTGIVWGGILTFTGTTMSITPGVGLIINHNASTSSHGDTVPTYVKFGPITASATYITSSQVTYLLIDTDGTLIQQPTIFTPQQFNEKLPLGYIFCLTTSSISSYADARTTTYGQDEQQTQFIRAFGPLKVNGYDITPQSGSLKISIASGRTYRYGGFYTQNPDNPSIYDSTTVPTGSLVRIQRDPAIVGGFKAITNGGLPFTVIDPTMWDDGSGTLQSVGASEWTIQRLFQGVVNNITYVYYGQNTYDSLNAAIQSITTEAFEEAQTSILALPFIGYVICKGNTTNLADTTENKIINSGLFRNTAGSSGGGGVATTTLNDLSDVTITSPSTGQALVYNAGIWVNSNPTSASYASTASYILEAVSASYATLAQTANTASFVQTAQTASYVLQAVSSSYATTSSYASSGNGIFSGSFSGSFEGNGSGLTGIIATAAPAGPDTSIQFNSGGTTAGSADLTFNDTTNKLTLTGSLYITGSVDATIFTNTLKISGSSGASGNYITTQFLGSDVTNSTTGLVTAMTTTGVGPGLYQFKYVVRYQSAATTTGIGLAVDHTQAANYFVSSFWFISTGGAAATGVADQVATTNAGQMAEGKSERVKGTVSSTTAGVDTINADMLAVMEGLIDVSTSGDLILEFRSEVAASQVTIKSGTSLILTKMS